MMNKVLFFEMLIVKFPCFPVNFLLSSPKYNLESPAFKGLKGTVFARGFHKLHEEQGSYPSWSLHLQSHSPAATQHRHTQCCSQKQGVAQEIMNDKKHLLDLLEGVT